MVLYKWNLSKSYTPKKSEIVFCHYCSYRLIQFPKAKSGHQENLEPSIKIKHQDETSKTCS